MNWGCNNRSLMSICLATGLIAPLVLIGADRQSSKGSDSSRSSGSTRSGSSSSTNEHQFQIVVTRNIFNPDRGYRPPPKPKSDPRPPAPPKADRLALTGALVTANGNYGFFDGTKSEFRRVARANSEIAGLKIVEITSKHASLRDGTNTYVLKVGSEMEKPVDSPWKLSEGRSSFSSGGSLSSSSGVATSSTGSSTSGAGSAADERRAALLKALLERKKSGK